jgi:hypothetical protein
VVVVFSTTTFIALPCLASPCLAPFTGHRETLDALYRALKVEPGDLLVREHEEQESSETRYGWHWRGMARRGMARKARGVNATPLAMCLRQILLLP